MASTSYTENLGLCAWNSTDKPKRIDFVNDNAKIDAQLGGHIFDKSMHVTTQEKARIYEPYKVVTYAGDGTQSRTLSLDYEYNFAIVFQKHYPPVTTDNSGNTVLRSAVVGRMFGSNSGLVLKSDSIVLLQQTTATDSVINNFNEKNGQYVMILFK